MKYVVRRGSHVHQTPHSKRVQKMPETIVQTTKTRPTSMATFARASKARACVMRTRTEQYAMNTSMSALATATGTCQ